MAGVGSAGFIDCWILIAWMVDPHFSIKTAATPDDAVFSIEAVAC
jgi:hypothetical protein